MTRVVIVDRSHPHYGETGEGAFVPGVPMVLIRLASCSRGVERCYVMRSATEETHE